MTGTTTQDSKSIQLIGLSALTTMLAFPLRLIKPLSSTLSRIFWLTAAKIKNAGFDGSVQFDGKIYLIGTGNVNIGSRSRIGPGVEFGTEASGHIVLGKSVRVNRGTTLVSYEHISIGDDTLIGEFVSIRDANHGVSPEKLIREQPHTRKAIKIGRDVWIGRGSVILPGVEIGDGSIIGANSVVTKSVPAGTIAVGSPAKPLRKR